MGGAGDLWVFVTQQPRRNRRQTLSSCYLFGLLAQRELGRGGPAPAFLLDWDDDAGLLTSGQGRTVLSHHLRHAQEVLLGSKPGHILVSGGCLAALDLRGSVAKDDVRAVFAAGESTRSQLRQEVEVLNVLTPSKSSLAAASITYSRDGETVAGCRQEYVELTAIEHRDHAPGRQRGEGFIRLLTTHNECVIIGVTNEHLAESYLLPALERRHALGKGFWNRIVVIFPAAASVARVREENRLPEERLQQRASGLRTVISLFRAKEPTGSHWTVLEYEDNLPFVGNWMGDGPRNSIRLAPLMPGCNVDETFVVELPQSTAAYAEAYRSFITIEQKSTPVGEWNLLGTEVAGEYHWSQIISRSETPEEVRREAFQAVVLVLVHGITSRGHKVFLQLRSHLNGSTALGLYSNISGKVTVQDAYAAAGVDPPDLVSPEDGPALMWDIQERAVLKPDQELPREVWLRAAIREVDEELGLEIDKSRLKDHGHMTLIRSGRRHSLYFRIFSLQLRTVRQGQRTIAEINQIRQNRVGSGMDRGYSLRDIIGLKQGQRLNDLLAVNLDRFLEIYQALGINDE